MLCTRKHYVVNSCVILLTLQTQRSGTMNDDNHNSKATLETSPDSDHNNTLSSLCSALHSSCPAEDYKRPSSITRVVGTVYSATNVVQLLTCNNNYTSLSNMLCTRKQYVVDSCVILLTLQTQRTGTMNDDNHNSKATLKTSPDGDHYNTLSSLCSAPHSSCPAEDYIYVEHIAECYYYSYKMICLFINHELIISFWMKYSTTVNIKLYTINKCYTLFLISCIIPLTLQTQRTGTMNDDNHKSKAILETSPDGDHNNTPLSLCSAQLSSCLSEVYIYVEHFAECYYYPYKMIFLFINHELVISFWMKYSTIVNIKLYTINKCYIFLFVQAQLSGAMIVGISESLPAGVTSHTTTHLPNQLSHQLAPLSSRLAAASAFVGIVTVLYHYAYSIIYHYTTNEFLIFTLRAIHMDLIIVGYPDHNNPIDVADQSPLMHCLYYIDICHTSKLWHTITSGAMLNCSFFSPARNVAVILLRYIEYTLPSEIMYSLKTITAVSCPTSHTILTRRHTRSRYFITMLTTDKPVLFILWFANAVFLIFSSLYITLSSNTSKTHTHHIRHTVENSAPHQESLYANYPQLVEGVPTKYQRDVTNTHFIAYILVSNHILMGKGAWTVQMTESTYQCLETLNFVHVVLRHPESRFLCSVSSVLSVGMGSCDTCISVYMNDDYKPTWES